MAKGNEGNVEALCKVLPNLSKHFKDDEEFLLLTKKGVFSYDWYDRYEKLDSGEFPTQEECYSELYGTPMPDEDYQHMLEVRKKFGHTTFRKYYDLYMLTDGLLLADVMLTHIEVCHQHFGLDPCWYYTTPGLALDSNLKITGQVLEPLPDHDMVQMFEKGICGGLAMAVTRYAEANNKYMKKLDKNKPSSYIVYVDANNL